MGNEQVRVLLIEDNPLDVNLVREMLPRAKDPPFVIEDFGLLSSGLERLAEDGIDVLLLDLSLPDSRGLETFIRAHTQAPQVPIVILSAIENEALAVEAVEKGAQDYLIKGQVDGNLLVRAMRYAIERNRTEKALRQRNREMALLNQAGHTLSSSLDLDRVLASLLEEVRHMMDVTASSVWLIDPETDELVCQQVTGPQSELVRGWRLPQSEGLVGWAARCRESVIVPDVTIDKRHFEGVDKKTGLPLRSILSTPLWVKQGVIGVLQVVDTEAGRFDTRDLALIDPLAASAAIAIENARLYERAQQEIIERKQVEEQLKILSLAIEQSTSSVAILDREARIQYANPKLLELYEYSFEKVAGKHWRSFVSEHSTLWEKDQEIGDTVMGKGMMWKGEVSDRAKNGDVVWREATIFPVKDAEGEITHYTYISEDITERKQAEQELLQYAEYLRTLTTRLAEAEEIERRRIARDLHDRVGQNLTALGINLNIARAQIPEEAELARSRLDDSLALVDETTECIRNVMADLRPPVLDDYGLVAALRWHGERITSRTGIAVTVHGEEPDPRLAAHTENALFRIVQEALTNVSKHAQATQATVKVEEDGATVFLTVEDNGIGFEPADLTGPDVHAGWGLLTMTERAEAVGGKCRIESRPGQGTQIIVEVPR